MNKSKTRNNTGITLIALIITIIVLLILAGVSISALVGDNGVLTQATKAKEKTDIASLKEEIEMELLTIDYDEEGKNTNLTVSEKIDKLKENSVLNDDMTFKLNNNYRLTYCGNIIDNNYAIKDKVKISNNINSVEILPHPSVSGKINGNIKISCIDGTVYSPTTGVRPGEENTVAALIANEAPYGYKFAYWVNEFDEVVSFDYALYLNQIVDQIFSVVYVKYDVAVNIVPCVTSYATNKTTDDGTFVNGLVFLTLAYNIDSVGGEDTNFIRLTTLTPESSLANEEMMNFESTDDRPRMYVVKVNVSGSMYSWTFNKTNAGSAPWYYRGGINILKEDGTSQIIYSPRIISIQK